jgi:hypothetical protein
MKTDILNRIYQAEDKARTLRNAAIGDELPELADAVAQGLQAIAEALKTIDTSSWRD